MLFSFVGLLSLRFVESKLLELLFQLPPRTPRADELNRPGYPCLYSAPSRSTSAQQRAAKSQTLGMRRMGNPCLHALRYFRRRAYALVDFPFHLTVPLLESPRR